MNNPIVLETISFPDPVISVAIEPKTLADQDKMSEALQKLAEEDPTFKVRVDDETGQTIISGMGELHLDILVDRMLREFKVQANVGNLGLLTMRQSPKPFLKQNINLLNKPVAMVNMVMLSSGLNLWKAVPVLSS